MKNHLGRWLMGLVMLLVLAGSYTPADAQVVIAVGHHHHHRRHYHHHYYRH